MTGEVRPDFRLCQHGQMVEIRYAPAFAAQSEALAAETSTPFLLLPGTAPNERGRAAARRPIATQPVGSLPNCPSEAEHWLANLWVCGGSTRRDNSCWRASWGGGRQCGASSAIHLRRPARSGRPKAGSAERSGAEGSPWHTLSESVLDRWRAQSPRRSRIRKALRKTGFPLGWGVERPTAQRAGSNWGRVPTLPHEQDTQRT